MADVDHSPEEALNPEQANRRLPNAFILFCKKHRSIVKEKYPNLENRNITKILGEWWTSLGPDEKNAFNNLAAELKEHHHSKEHQAVVQRKPAPAQQQQHIQHRDLQLVENTSSNLSAAVILAAASPTAPYWQKQRQQGGNGWQPQQPLLLQQQQQQPQPSSNIVINPPSRNSSGSSSPEPSPKPAEGNPNNPVVDNMPHGPKKTFKQRYLADEKAKLVSLPAIAAEPETNACEALLQLAGGGVHHAVSHVAASGETTRSNSGTCSPKDQGDISSGVVRRSGAAAGFQSLRDAVWNRVAQTILMQDKEKGNDCEGTDQPINLSNQCTIQSQTIIEHIIENMLDEPMPQGQGLNNNRTGSADGVETAEQIKERIYQSLKDDIMNRAANNIQDEFKGSNALWNRLPNPKPSGNTPLPDGAVTLLPAAANSNAKKLPTPPPTTPTPPMTTTTAASAAPVVANPVVVVASKNDTDPLQIKPSVSVTLVPVYSGEGAGNGASGAIETPLNLSTTPPQTPISSGSMSGVAITITTSSPAKRIILDDDDDDIRRSSRTCKGRRYQEFKDAVGRKGRRSHRSGDSSDLMSEEENTLTPLNLLSPNTTQRSNPTPESNGTSSQSHPGRLVPQQPSQSEPDKSSIPGKFDVDKELNAIPALNLDLFQQKILNNRIAARAAATAPVVQKRAGPFESGPGHHPVVKKKPRKVSDPPKQVIHVGHQQQHQDHN